MKLFSGNEEATHSPPKLMAGYVGTKAQKQKSDKMEQVFKGDWNQEMAVTNAGKVLIYKVKPRYSQIWRS